MSEEKPYKIKFRSKKTDFTPVERLEKVEEKLDLALRQLKDLTLAIKVIQDRYNAPQDNKDN